MNGVAAGPVRQLVLQATSFCNIDCHYCYLPNRRTAAFMTEDVVHRVAAALARRRDLLGAELEVRWHAGEPLAAPPRFFDRAHEILDATLGDVVRLTYTLQTNATLVDRRWADLFRRHAIRVGVSLDGPRDLHDRSRVTRAGRGTFDRAMAGVRHLQDAGIGVGVISVITEATLDHQEAYLAFLEGLAPRSVSLNPEETEGVNRSSLPATQQFHDRYRRFLTGMLRFQERTGIPVRDLVAMRSHITRHRLPVVNTQVEPLMIVSVAVSGRVSTFSPELLDASGGEYEDFTLGDVTDPGFGFAGTRPGFRALARDVRRGKEECARTCGYFSLCGGGAPSNKLAENGTVASTETATCRSRVMAVADVVLTDLESRASS